MIQRPISPPGLPTHSGSSGGGGRMATSLRGRVSRRKCGGGVAVCCAAALCVLFFMAEMHESDLAVSSAVSSAALEAETSGSSREGTAATALPAKNEAKADRQGAPAEKEVGEPIERDSVGFTRFSGFVEYVEAMRADGASSMMPVVEKEGEGVTVPALIIIGAQRAGTSSLFRMLGQHPNVGSIEPQFYGDDFSGFMSQDPAVYPSEVEWPGDGLETELSAAALGDLLGAYAGRYTFSESRDEGGSSGKLLAAQLSADYLASPLAPYRLKISMPNVKIVVVLRDPVDRYFSELRALLCVPKEEDIDWDDISASFAEPNASKAYLSEAVLDFSPYDKRCLGEGASAADLWACQQAARKSHRPLLEGLYAGQLGRWLRAFDKSQIKVVSSTTLFAEPEKAAADVAKFAGLGDHTFYEFAVDRESSCEPRRRSQAVSTAYHKRKEAEPNFRKWYADHNDMVTELLDRDMGWNDRIQSMRVREGDGDGGLS